jgi:hypothetical protein
MMYPRVVSASFVGGSIIEEPRTRLAAALADANASDAQSTFSQSLVESTLVTINAMPAGLPYDLA